MKLRVLPALAGILVILTVPALAHHSFASFWYLDKTIEITGIVKSIKVVNPHPEMQLEVTESNGEKSTWSVTATSSGTAIRRAWGVEDAFERLPVGTKIKVEGHPSRKEGAKALAAGTITLPDGKQLPFGGTLGVPQG
jgi:hypothetical protein